MVVSTKQAKARKKNPKNRMMSDKRIRSLQNFLDESISVLQCLLSLANLKKKIRIFFRNKTLDAAIMKAL